MPIKALALTGLDTETRNFGGAHLVTTLPLSYIANRKLAS